MSIKDDYTDEERENLAAEPEIVLNTVAPKAKGFNFKIIGAIAMGLVLIVFIVLQFNLLGKKPKTAEELEKEENAKVETATSQAMQGVDAVNRLPATYQNQNSQMPESLPQAQTGPLNNQDLMDAQQKAAMQNAQQTQYGGQQPGLPAPTQEQQMEFDEKRRIKQIEENRAMQRENDERERLKAIAQAQKQALESSIKFNSGSNRAASKAEPKDNKSTQSKPSGMQMPNFQMPDLGLGESDLNKQKDKQTFLDAERNKATYLKSNMSYPVSPYQIMAGAIIPASFITGVNSDLPGQIIGQVRENVYDTVTGRYLLVPQSTRIIGEYSSGITFGQDRILIVWTRLIFPNGMSINLEGMPGVDLSGYAGSADKVNHHFMKIATGAVLSSLMGAGVKVAAGNQEAGSANFQQLAAGGAAQTMGQAGDKILGKMIDQQSTITIRPGMKFNVFVNKDIILKPFTHR